MDLGESWGFRARSAKHQSSSSSSPSTAMHPASSLYPEGDDDMWEFFPCPFCYVDVEVPVLCNHLQEEHCFDMKNAVCPLCAANLGKDMIGHFVAQHAHMLKRRKTLRKSSWNNSTVMDEKEPHEVGYFHGVASTDRRNAPDSAPDPLLSPFICSISFQVTQGDLKPDRVTDARVTSTSLHVHRSERSTSNKASVKDNEETNMRAEFLQQMLLSTIF